MRKAVTDGTVYDDLDAWTKLRGMDADTVGPLRQVFDEARREQATGG